MIRTRGPRGPAGASASTTQLAADLYALRRSAVDATSRLRWECQETSGTIDNTGSLGAAGDLATVGASTVYRAFSPRSTVGRGLKFEGGSSAYASGAAGQVIGDGSAVTLWAVVVCHSLAAKRYVVARDYGAPGGWADPYLAASLAVGPAGLSVRVNKGGSPGDGFEFDSGAIVVERQYLIGLTYDSTTLRAWIDGVETGSTAGGGNINWGDPTALWHLARNDNGEYAHVTVLRAGAEASVWNAARWESEYGLLVAVPT